MEFCFDDSADFGSGSGERGFISDKEADFIFWVEAGVEK